MNKEKLDLSLSKFYSRCKEHDVKITPQRVEIFKELIKYNDHPSVKKVYQRVKKKFPNISFDTVNRTLQKFVEIGLSKIVEGYDDFRRYDAVIEKHHHFHCIKCHSVIDIYNKKLDELIIPVVLDEAFMVIDSKIVFEGLCDKCKKE